MTAPQKGIGFIRETECSDIARLQGSWYYNWWYVPDCDVPGTTFIPMIWSHRDVTDDVFDAIRRQAPPAVLTWNEPSLVTQAGLPLLDSPENLNTVLGYWRTILEAIRPTGIRIGSPAPAPEEEDIQWVRQFLTELYVRDMSPDFIALHYYFRLGAKSSGAQDFYSFLCAWRAWLDQTLRLPLPIWITEYGCIDQSQEANRTFMEESFDLMLSQGKFNQLNVERYCWFANRTFHPVFFNSALIASDGALTQLGAIYRSVPATYATQ